MIVILAKSPVFESKDDSSNRHRILLGYQQRKRKIDEFFVITQSIDEDCLGEVSARSSFTVKATIINRNEVNRCKQACAEWQKQCRLAFEEYEPSPFSVQLLTLESDMAISEMELA